MKKLQTLLAIAMSGVLLNLSVSAQTAKPSYATVVRVKGAASYSLDGGAHKYPLVPGKYLEAGAGIYTGEDGVVDIVLGKSTDLPQASSVPDRISYAPDSPVRGMISYSPSVIQNAVRVMANSVLVIDKLTSISSGIDAVSDTELDLQKGGIYASVKKLSPAAQYLVKTPTGIAGVRGTEFTIVLNDDGSIKQVTVYKTAGDDGLVLAVSSSGGGAAETYVIRAGEVWQPGMPNPVPITPELRSLLHEVFVALHTEFFQSVNFDRNHHRQFTSDDFGDD